MDIAKLLPLLLAMQNNGSENNANINQILPEIIKAQALGTQSTNGSEASGNQTALTSMLLNMLTRNFNKQNAGMQNSQNKQPDIEPAETKMQNAATEQPNFNTIKNYKNFYAPPEYSEVKIASAATEQTASTEQNSKSVNGVYPSEIKEQPTSNNKNSVENNATNIKTPFGYTRLY